MQYPRNGEDNYTKWKKGTAQCAGQCACLLVVVFCIPPPPVHALVPQACSTGSPPGQARRRVRFPRNYTLYLEHSSEALRDGYSISGSAEVPEPDEPLQVDPDSSGFTSCPSSLLPSESSQPHTNSTRRQTIPTDSPECAGQFLSSKKNDEQDAISSLKSLLEGLPAHTRRPKLASSAEDLVEALPDRHAHHSEITSSEAALSNDDHLRRIVSLIKVAKDTPRRARPHAAAQINKTLPLHKGTTISQGHYYFANATRVKDAAAGECDQCADEEARVDNSAGGENGGEEEESDWSNLVLLKHVAGDRLSLYNHLANIPLESTTSETEKEDERVDTDNTKSLQDICNAGKRANEATRSVATRSSRPLDATYQTLRHKTHELLES